MPTGSEVAALVIIFAKIYVANESVSNNHLNSRSILLRLLQQMICRILVGKKELFPRYLRLNMRPTARKDSAGVPGATLNENGASTNGPWLARKVSPWKCSSGQRSFS